MRPPPGRWWLLLWLPPLSTPPAGAVRGEGEEAAAAALSVLRCKALKEMDFIETSDSGCYCYNRNSQMEWKYMWSTMQVKITSSGLLNIVYITERHNCQYPETILSFIKCMIHNFWTPKESNEITIIINPYGETMCFSVKPVRKIFVYTISVNRNIYVVCQLMEDLKWLWRENRIYILGYVLTVGFLSFAVCYKHGPLVDERSVNLLTWTLRLLALLLIYCGVTVPQCSYAVMILVLSSRSLRYPLKAFSYMTWKMKKWFTSEKLVVKYLTEDEYREQADMETSSALEELRRACRRPDFPAWLVVSRLQAPNKFADFVLGGSHLSPEEISLHEEQYGFGGAFLEEQLFNLRTA
ncbi:nuclear envelope integral membrane protein 2 isoform X2 [Ursus maritimus]|uniref:Nuclear envelope integral membrane protein 2 isoform X2 n=1 Tax=Ursus maritimus TaxID=29073 RepID=A0A8M1GSM8_URSMA|nr:nuclear envelope integral membrane protein 2 isoform X2 [Ursus maritimus]XP_048069976.1 nuclear envelope integral membrane protein 2 isoform X3 [Ursus arctos]